MSEEDSSIKKNVKICLLGANFDTGNMGVAALAEASIKCILNRWPDAEVTLLGSSRAAGKDQLKLSGREVKIKKIPIRFCWNVFLPCHFVVFFLNAVLLKSLPWNWSKKLFSTINPYVRDILETDVALDITGGDSFSDIYGMRRFILGFLRKWLVLLFNKDLIMLPQTYGPFKRRTAKAMARYILKRASLVYSRDQAGKEYVNKLLNKGAENGKVRFAPDVAFVLDSHRPENIDIGKLGNLRVEDTTVVGLNVSGLLFNGGYTRDNMFALKTDYRELISEIIKMLLKDENIVVLLVPHVFPPEGYEVESDADACRHVYDSSVARQQKNRIFLANSEYTHNEIKYIIGLCDFFIGSRMHACIAALSQSIPAIGLAYSQKFWGVFESVGLANCVADVRSIDTKGVLQKINTMLGKRQEIKRHLQDNIPQVKANILNILEGNE